jgi:LCP family protein required for cell wall assembly
MKSRWKRVLLWSVVGVVVAAIIVAGASYLWFDLQVGASNKRVDQAIIDALNEKPSTTLTSASGSTSTTLAGSLPTLPPSSSTTEPAGTTTTAPFESPSGMNIVLLGYDLRAPGSTEVTEGRSDVIILLHIDPEKGFLSLLSVPRDLRVKVEGFGHRKINAAYAYGGGALLIRTIQNELGIDLDHYIAVNLEAFKAITDSLGGVYIDVDRPYDDGKIEFDPGFQLLDGLNAERFVRTRHDQNIDFGRMARQQRYLSAVRQQVSQWNLPLKLPGLIKTIFKYADTDLSAGEVVKLAYWATKLDNNGIKRAEIIGATGDMNGSFYILPTPEELAAAREDFFTPPAKTNESSNTAALESPAAPATLTPADLKGISVDLVNATGRSGQAAFAGVWLLRQGATIGDLTTGELPVTGTGVVEYSGSRQESAQRVAQALGIARVEKSSSIVGVRVILGESYGITGAQLAGTTAPALRLAATEPASSQAGLALMPSVFTYSFDRAYEIDTHDGNKPAVRVGYRYKGEDLYAGVSATTWTDAPLASPGVKVEGDGVTYSVVGASNKTDIVWWVKDGVLYWVSNTIFADLTREQMIAIAVSCVAVPAAN